MKLFAGILLLGTSVLSAYGQAPQAQQTPKVKWYTIQEALKLNETTPKKIMVDVYTDWCGWCKEMDKSTFSNPVIAEYMNENYYPVKFNAESGDSLVFLGKVYKNPEGGGYRTSHQFAVALLNGQMSFPSIAYINEKLVFMGAVPGYRKADEMEILLHFIAEEKYKTETYDQFKSTFVGKLKAAVVVPMKP